MTLSRAEWRNPWVWLASGLGPGLAPKAPGTLGSLAALLPYVFLRDLHWLWLAAAIVLVFLLGIVVANRLRAIIAVDDPGLMVLDEYVGQWLSLLPALWLSASGHWHLPLPLELGLGFALFRLFDIWKPWPVSYADREVSGGFGAMLDDALAGVYAGLALMLANEIYGRL